MPKRSNEFQRLVRVIYEQLLPAGATVTESALVKERGSEVRREVDILIEQPVADVTLRLAVECRDRSRSADIEWIDQLIGKYRDLPIDRVIAVSRIGFTENAEGRASANGIDTRSLLDALASDWPAELVTLTMARFKMSLRLTRWGLTTVPPWQGDEPVAICIGEVTVQAKELVTLFQRNLTGQVADFILKRWKTFADSSKPWVQPVSVEVPEGPEAHAVGKDGFNAKVMGLFFLFEGSAEVTPVPVHRHLYGAVGVTSAAIQIPELKQAFKVTVVQSPGKSISRPIVEALPGADQTYST